MTHLLTKEIATNIFTIISDCVILVLPIQLVWSIQRSRQERWGVLAVFLVGFFSTLISCVRLYSIRIYTLSPDPIQDAAPINMWSFIEIYSGMLCVSTPGNIHPHHNFTNFPTDVLPSYESTIQQACKEGVASGIVINRRVVIIRTRSMAAKTLLPGHHFR